MLIQVKQCHIDNGRPQENSSCALALAIREATGDTSYRVGATHVYRIGEGYDVYTKNRVELPGEAFQFRCDFDAQRPVEPFEFELAIPGRKGGASCRFP